MKIQVVRGKLLSAREKETIIALCARAYEEDMAPLVKPFVDATYVLGGQNDSLASLSSRDAPLLKTAYIEAVASEKAWR